MITATHVTILRGDAATAGRSSSSCRATSWRQVHERVARIDAAVPRSFFVAPLSRLREPHVD